MSLPRCLLIPAQLFVAWGLAASATTNQLTPEEKAAGWELLFDGRTTSGWLEVTGLPFPRSSWKIDGGCLKAFPNPSGFQDIRTAGAYRSFDLRFEWKIAANGNSGVKYFIHKAERWRTRRRRGYQARARGAEYQLVDDRRGQAFDTARTSGALYGVLGPTLNAARPAGNFNESRILVQGRHVEHWLNGSKVLEYDAEAPVESFLALQNHNSEAWFRNIKVLRLKDR